ncbi:hypothetical protein I552_1028 [Mycobacterium xenopi 3993]|nr:hypothetical protein I552_1028 [Mycobacterium xenopi 3993]
MGKTVCEVTELDSLSLLVLSPAVMRSVSVTDFLSSPADFVKRGVRCTQPNHRVRPTINSATVIAWIGGVCGEPSSTRRIWWLS